MDLKKIVLLLAFAMPFLPTTMADEDPEIKILAYNVFLRPDPVGWFDWKPERFEELSESVRQYDIIGLCEVFDDKLRQRWKDILSDTHPHFIDPPKKKWERMIFNGGIMFFSRYPIVFHEKIVYTKTGNWDAFADKGAIFARFQLPSGKTFEVVLTHIQAGGEQYTPNKKSQMQEMQALIKKNQTGPLFFMGDFNVTDETDLHDFLMQTFQQPQDAFRTLHKGPGYTSNGEENPLCGGDKKKRIDYIFYHDPNNEIRILKSAVAKFPMKNPIGKALFMSDHYAVESTVKIGKNTTSQISSEISAKVDVVFPKDFREVKGTVQVIDSEGNKVIQNLVSSNPSLNFQGLQSGRWHVRMVTEGRIVNRILKVEHNQTIHLVAPYGSASCDVAVPKKLPKPLQARISGQFFWEDKNFSEASLKFNEMPPGKYLFSFESAKNTVTKSIIVK